MRNLIAAAVLLTAAGTTLPAPAEEALGPKIKEVFEQTKTASTEQEFTFIVDRCGELLGQTTEAERIQYLTQLRSWALNKRGELYAERAAAAEDAAAAEQLDNLALQDFEASVAADPQRWRAVHNRGVSYALGGHPKEAEADFTRTVELNPKYPNAWFNRAEIRFEQGSFADALGDYGQVLSLAPGDHGAVLGRGRCRYHLGDYQASVEDLSAAIKASADSDVVVSRGRAYQALRQWASAAADFRQAVEADGASVDAYRAAAWLMAVCPDEQFRNGPLGVEAAQKAADLERQQRGELSAATLDTLAAAHANQGSLDKAAQYAQQALQRGDVLDKATRDEIAERLRMYQQGRPFRVATRAGSTTR